MVKETQLVQIDTIICKGSSIYGYSIPGTYKDLFQTKEGCDSTRVLQLMLKPTVETNIIQFICEGDTFDGYSKTGIYQDTFALEPGCDSIRVLDLQVGSVFIPNIFSPNGDNINDFFQVFSKDETIEIKAYRIFNRWGSIIYEVKNFKINELDKWWNGESKGKKMNNGSYTYYIEISCSDKIIPFKGSVTLVNE